MCVPCEWLEVVWEKRLSVDGEGRVETERKSHPRVSPEEGRLIKCTDNRGIGAVIAGTMTATAGGTTVIAVGVAGNTLAVLAHDMRAALSRCAPRERAALAQ